MNEHTFYAKILENIMGWKPNISLYTFPKKKFMEIHRCFRPEDLSEKLSGFVVPKPCVIKQHSEECPSLCYQTVRFQIYISKEQDPSLCCYEHYLAHAHIHELMHIYYPCKSERQNFRVGLAIFLGLFKNVQMKRRDKQMVFYHTKRKLEKQIKEEEK